MINYQMRNFLSNKIFIGNLLLIKFVALSRTRHAFCLVRLFYLNQVF